MCDNLWSLKLVIAYLTLFLGAGIQNLKWLFPEYDKYS